MKDKIKEFEDAFCKALLDDGSEFLNACQEHAHKEIETLLSVNLLPRMIRVFGIFCKKYNLTENYSHEEMQMVLQGPMLAFMNVTLMSVIKSAIDNCTINSTVQMVDANDENAKPDPVTFVKADRVVH